MTGTRPVKRFGVNVAHLSGIDSKPIRKRQVEMKKNKSQVQSEAMGKPKFVRRRILSEEVVRIDDVTDDGEPVTNDGEKVIDTRTISLQEIQLPDEDLLPADINDRTAQRQAGRSKPTSSGDKVRDIRKRFRFNKAQAFFDGEDLGLPTGAEVNPVEMLAKLVKSFEKVVPFKDLDENSGDTASDFLRGKIVSIRRALEEHEVPCKIPPAKRYAGYILNTSHTHS